MGCGGSKQKFDIELQIEVVSSYTKKYKGKKSAHHGELAKVRLHGTEGTSTWITLTEGGKMPTIVDPKAVGLSGNHSFPMSFGILPIPDRIADEICRPSLVSGSGSKGGQSSLVRGEGAGHPAGGDYRLSLPPMAGGWSSPPSCSRWGGHWRID